MTTHTTEEAVDAVWTGSCERHDGADPESCGAAEDLAAYRERYEGIEHWYLGA